MATTGRDKDVRMINVNWRCRPYEDFKCCEKETIRLKLACQSAYRMKRVICWLCLFQWPIKVFCFQVFASVWFYSWTKMFSLENATASWNDLFYAKADPRIRDNLFMGSPLPTLIICLSYLFVVKSVLPNFMENRKPFNTRRVMLANNLWLFLASIYFFYQASTLAWLATYSWRCEPLDTSTSSSSMAIVNLCWRFFLFKFTYMSETFIHLLGKRDDFVTKYHVVHHFTLPMTCWIITNYLPGGHATFFGWLNPGECMRWNDTRRESNRISDQQVSTSSFLAT